MLDISLCVPEVDDEGIWAVRLDDQKLVCSSIEMLDVKFPVYASGAHKQYHEFRGCKYKDMLAFAKQLKQVATGPEPAIGQWTEWSNSDNEYIAMWAV